jgi:Protein of unknown function (DUF3667)
MSPRLITCQSCLKRYQGEFCNQCGEKRFDPEQRKISILFAHLIESLVQVDGKFFRTLRYFFTKPGFLAYEHWRGVRKPYMTPVAFFLIINVIYFLFSPLTDFAIPLSNQAIQPYSQWVAPTIDSYISQNTTTFEQLAVRYDALSGAIAKSLVILSLPFFIPFIWLVNPSRKYYLLDHSVSALYLYSFVLVWPMIITSLMTAFFALASGWKSPQGLILLLLLTPYYIYAVLFQSFMYRNKWWVCLIKGFIITIGIIISHFIYRFIQFWIVWWQII